MYSIQVRKSEYKTGEKSVQQVRREYNRKFY